MAVREGAITAAHCLSKRPGIPSDPVAFRGSIDSRCFRTEFQRTLGKRQIDTLAKLFHSVSLPGPGGRGARDDVHQ